MPATHPKKTQPHTASTSHSSRDGRTRAFHDTMQQARSHMNPLQRMFSRFIHLRTVSFVSDMVGGTIARPNTILYGSIAAFVLTLVVYIIAKTHGYALAGSETLAAFFLGWLLGITIDYTHTLIRGGRESNTRS